MLQPSYGAEQAIAVLHRGCYFKEPPLLRALADGNALPRASQLTNGTCSCSSLVVQSYSCSSEFHGPCVLNRSQTDTRHTGTSECTAGTGAYGQRIRDC